jgi:hypothetical protein
VACQEESFASDFEVAIENGRCKNFTIFYQQLRAYDSIDLQGAVQ